MPIIDTIKSQLFATPMPDMPPQLREIWQVAFMYRRKYSYPVDKDVDNFFRSAWNDALFIAEQYNNSETVMGLMVEVYHDIERQWKAMHQRENPELTGMERVGAEYTHA